MSLKLVYLARLRDALGSSGEEVPLPSGVADVDAVRGWLRQRDGAWATELAPGRAVRVAVNHEMVEGAHPVRDGDEVAFFPPVTGG
jgi:molybdopterin synthase sulfur carrier subunit